MTGDDANDAEAALRDEIGRTRALLCKQGANTVSTARQSARGSPETGPTPAMPRGDCGKTQRPDENLSTMSNNSDNENENDDPNRTNDDVSELDQMDRMLADAMEQLYYKSCGDGRIRDPEREELRLKMLKTLSTLARTRMTVYEQRELEDMRAELVDLLDQAETEADDSESSPIAPPTEIEHVIDGHGAIVDGCRR